MANTKKSTASPKTKSNRTKQTCQLNDAILTPRQIETLRFIRDYRNNFGCSPTLREIAEKSGVSRVTVFGHIEALIEKGFLCREPNKVRSLIVSEQAREYFDYLDDNAAATDYIDQEVETVATYNSKHHDQPEEGLSCGQYPMAGFIAAGRPLDALEMPDTLDLTTMFETRKGTFALKVRGESMIEEHICNGDYVLIEKTNQFHDGQIVVALLEDGQATLKKLYRQKNGGYKLEGANPEFKPMFVDNVQVQGIVVGVVRSM
ncbi:MAG: repressor LexA [Sedimentisphaerales bacterium]|nr:repressor LexA [Sedimentisphaerales bacterium]